MTSTKCALLAALLAGQAVHAQSCKTPSTDCVEVGKLQLGVALGAGERSNPVRGESDIPLVVIPQVSYYGKRVFLENLEFGITLHEAETATLNLIATPGYDRVFFYRHDLQNFFIDGAQSSLAAPLVPNDDTGEGQSFPVRRRHTTYLAGPEWTFDYEGISGQLDALREVTGEHDGYEVRGAVAMPLVEKGTGALIVNAGFTWKSAELVRYYYGIDGLYRPGPALSPFIKLGYSRPLSRRWSLKAFAHYEYLDDAIADSPIVSDHAVLSVFAGVVFKIL